MNFLNSLFGSDTSIQAAPTKTPQQMQLLQQLGGLVNPDQFKMNQDFGPIRERALRDFQTRTQPSIQERFQASQGPRGFTRGSSGLEGTLAGAQTDLNLGLAAQEGQFNQQANQNMLQLLQQLMSPQVENIVTPSSKGALSDLMPLVGPALLALSGTGTGGAGYLPSLLSILSAL